MKRKHKIIILFRGTNVDRSFINKKELISVLCKDLKEKLKSKNKDNNNYTILDYVGPACAPANKKNNKKNPHKLTFTRILAATTGVIGPNNMRFNAKISYQDVLQTIEKFGRNNIEITIIGHSRGAIQAFMLANKLYNNKETKSIDINIIALDPVPGPITPSSAKYLSDNVKKCHLFLASECRMPFFTSMIPKMPNKTNKFIYSVPANHPGIVNTKIFPDKERPFRNVQATVATHINKYLKGFITNILHSYKINLLDLDDITKVKPEITLEEKHTLNIEGYKTGVVIKKKHKLEYWTAC